jgi:cyclic-di-GMP-binding protein
MNKAKPIDHLLEQLRVPSQDLAQLGFCDGIREASIKTWVSSLPLTQIQFVGGLLYQALPEVSRFQTGTSNRIRILETLRLPTAQTIEGLAQNFLNQPLIMPEAAVKTATVAQALQKHLNTGYKVVVRDLCKQSSPNLDELALSIHRAIAGIGLLLLRYYQLYVPVSSQLWAELHSLYQLALHFKIGALSVPETLRFHQHCNSISLAYIRILLLACSRPNQLRQDEIVGAYYALNQLSQLAKLQDISTNSYENLFAVALGSNHPPHYRSRLESLGHTLLLELDTSELSQYLKGMMQDNRAGHTDANPLPPELALSSHLTQHLMNAWNLLAQRNFDRLQTNGILDVTVGISSIHFHLAGATKFTHFLNRTQEFGSDMNSLFQKRGVQLKDISLQTHDQDPWVDAFDATGSALASGADATSTQNIENAIRTQEEKEPKEVHSIYQVPLIDTSPGGYCIEWRNEIPHQVKTGELLGIREPTYHRWSLGVVRWAHQTHAATQLGIQILAPIAEPIAIAIVHKTGDTSEYLRALAIPAMKAINQPATLITNAISFHEYSKARIYQRNENNPQKNSNENIQLTQRCFGTSAFHQYTYQALSTGKPQNDTPPDDFDAIWDS